MNYGIYPSIIAFDLLRPPYWILWGQYGSNLHFDLRNGISDPKNAIYHVSYYGIAMNYGIHPQSLNLTFCDRHIGFHGVIMGQIYILTSEMKSLTPKMVYIMYHTMVQLKCAKIIKSPFHGGVAIIDDPQNDLNDLEKIQPYDFWLDGILEVPNQP